MKDSGDRKGGDGIGGAFGYALPVQNGKYVELGGGNIEYPNAPIIDRYAPPKPEAKR